MELTDILAPALELLTVPSTADRPDELRRALDFVTGFVGPGFCVEKFESNGRPSALIYHQADRPAFRVILNGHLDVVPAGPEQFEPRVVGDRLFARGAQDMKVTALVMAAVFRELAAKLPYPLALQLVCDEEIGGRDGTLFQLDQAVTGDFVVIGENSGLDIVADSKGLLQARLTATGRNSHGAYPWLGDNALLKLVRTVDRLLERYPEPGEEVWRTTVNLARVATTNQAFNQVPADAEAWLDIRFPAGDDALNGRTAAELRDWLLLACEPDVTVDIVATNSPHHVDHDHPDVVELRAAARAAGYQGEFLAKHGSGDATYFAGRGIAAVAFGIAGGGQHGPQEWADLTTVMPYHAALTRFLTQLADPTG